MATYFRPLYGVQVQQSEATAAYRTIPYEVAVHAAQTITVSKNGGAYGATAGTVGAQVEGTQYKLVIHADDIDTLGYVVFKSVAGVNTHYLMGIQVVSHDPITSIAAIEDDTGTTGVAIANGAITAAKLGANAITSAAFATSACDAIADEVLKELLADHDGTAGSLAEAVRWIVQAQVGKWVTDSTAKTIKIYDTDGLTLLRTLTNVEAGVNITRTPS